MQNSYDVVVVGAGIIGITCAYRLAEAGKSVLVLDRADTCAGAGGGSQGVVSWYTKQPGFHRNLFMKSWDGLHRLEEELGGLFINWKEGYIQLAETDEEMEEVHKTYRSAEVPEGFTISVLDRKQTLEMEPFVRQDVRGSLFIPDCGYFDLLPFIFKMLQAAKDKGAVFMNEVEVTGLIKTDSHVKGVHSTKGDFYADTVINCAGYYGSKIAAMAGLDLSIKPRRGHTIVCQQMPPMIFHNVYSMLYNIIKYHPELIKDEIVREHGINCTLHQTDDGSIYVTGSREMVGYDRRADNDVVRLILEGAMQRIPALKNVLVLRCFTGLRPYTEDGLPMIGAIDGLDGFFMCSGHEGDGIALSCVTGELVRDLLTKGSTDIIDVSRLSPMRFLKN